MIDFINDENSLLQEEPSRFCNLASPHMLVHGSLCSIWNDSVLKISIDRQLLKKKKKGHDTNLACRLDRIVGQSKINLIR